VIVGIDGEDRRGDWRDDWQVQWPSAVRVRSLPTLEILLSQSTTGSDEFRKIIDEDTSEELRAITEAPSSIAFEDDYGRELDAGIRKSRARVARQFYDELYRKGPEQYRAALEARSNPRKPTGGIADVLEAGVAVSVWAGLAVGSGALGNAAYDLLTQVTGSYRRRRKSIKETEEAEYSARRGQRFLLSIETPLSLEEATAVAYLSACASLKNGVDGRTPGLGSVHVLRHRAVECRQHGNQVRLSCTQCSESGWSLVIELDERLFRIWIPRGDPLATTVRVESVW
jgi:hypothetical protein